MATVDDEKTLEELRMATSSILGRNAQEPTERQQGEAAEPALTERTALEHLRTIVPPEQWEAMMNPTGWVADFMAIGQDLGVAMEALDSLGRFLAQGITLSSMGRTNPPPPSRQMIDARVQMAQPALGIIQGVLTQLKTWEAPAEGMPAGKE
jgi:hypothetical protein